MGNVISENALPMLSITEADKNYEGFFNEVNIDSLTRYLKSEDSNISQLSEQMGIDMATATSISMDFKKNIIAIRENYDTIITSIPEYMKNDINSYFRNL